MPRSGPHQTEWFGSHFTSQWVVQTGQNIVYSASVTLMKRDVCTEPIGFSKMTRTVFAPCCYLAKDTEVSDAMPQDYNAAWAPWCHSDLDLGPLATKTLSIYPCVQENIWILFEVVPSRHSWDITIKICQLYGSAQCCPANLIAQLSNKINVWEPCLVWIWTSR